MRQQSIHFTPTSDANLFSRFLGVLGIEIPSPWLDRILLAIYSNESSKESLEALVPQLEMVARNINIYSGTAIEQIGEKKTTKWFIVLSSLNNDGTVKFSVRMQSGTGIIVYPMNVTDRCFEAAILSARMNGFISTRTMIFYLEETIKANDDETYFSLPFAPTF